MFPGHVRPHAQSQITGPGVPLVGYSPRAWSAMIALGLVSQLAAYHALVHTLGHVPATMTSVGLLAQVPATAFLAWLLREPLTPMQITAGAVALIGIVVVISGA